MNPEAAARQLLESIRRQFPHAHAQVESDPGAVTLHMAPMLAAELVAILDEHYRSTI